MVGQIFLGSLLLGLCSLVHLVMFISWIRVLKSFSLKNAKSPTFMMAFIPIGGTFAVLVFSHTIQIWIWAFAFASMGALGDMGDAIYFSLVTYTTLGYGDVVLQDQFRTFGAMASVTGLLNFGISTAVLVALIAKVLPNQLGDA